MKFTFKIFLATSLLIGQSPDQVKQAKEFIKRTGMSEAQAISAAKAQGYSSEQIRNAVQNKEKQSKKPEQPVSEKLKKTAVRDLVKSNEVFQKNINSENGETFSEQGLEKIDESSLEIYSEKNDAVSFGSEKLNLNYFGYDIFNQDPALFQATSVGVVDPNYLIGPSDEIIVMLWGETQFRQVLTVDREGFVFIPEIGQVFVNGLDLRLLESKLFRVFSQSYASLNPQGSTPTTFLDVSLGNLRPLRIQVLGEVAQPGAYTVSPSATLFSSLYYFNGPTTLGSLREIQLIRGDKKISSIDFYNYLLTGKKPDDQKLQLDDVIFIPRRLKTVSIEGEINNPGVYELKTNENLKDLIVIAGDLKITAYLNRAQIDRIVPFEDREKLGVERMYSDVNLETILNSEQKFPLNDGDKITIFPVLDNRQNIVSIQGAVTRPGSYELVDSLTLNELIKKADGLIGNAYKERVDVIRVKPDFTEEIIKLNLAKALEGDNNNIYLQGLDRVKVYSITEMVSKTYVTILGHVKRPGRYDLMENMTLYDLIFKSGSFLDEEFRKKTFLERADLLRINDDNVTRNIIYFNLGELLDSPGTQNDLLLQANDIVRIYDKTIFDYNKSVSINGVVRNPGRYVYKSDMSLKDLILEAGGIERDVYRYRVEIASIDPKNKDITEYAKVYFFDVDKEFRLSSLDAKNDDGKEYLIGDDGTILLKPYDMVSIRQDPFFNYQSQVTVSGDVFYPGIYAILNSDEKISNILKRAGGLLPTAFLPGSTYIRKGEKINVSFDKIIKNPNSKYDFRVQDKDQINIIQNPNVIRVLGAVNLPGNHKYIPGKRLKFYLKLAGGLAPDADKSNIFVVYPNGDSKKYYNYSLFGPKIIDGSVIKIEKEKENEPLDKTEFAKELTGIFANLAQAITVILLATR